jgi:hypothetical protein
MALEFMFATARLKDPEMAEHFLEIDRLLAPAEKIETLAFSCRYASSSPHLAPGHEVPSITRRGMIRFDQVS